MGRWENGKMENGKWQWLVVNQEMKSKSVSINTPNKASEKKKNLRTLTIILEIPWVTTDMGMYGRYGRYVKIMWPLLFWDVGHGGSSKVDCWVVQGRLSLSLPVLPVNRYSLQMPRLSYDATLQLPLSLYVTVKEIDLPIDKLVSYIYVCIICITRALRAITCLISYIWCIFRG